MAFIDLENGAAEIKSRSAGSWSRLGLSAGRAGTAKQELAYNDATEPEDSLYALTLEAAGFKRLEEYLDKYEPEVVIMDCYGKAVPWEEKNEERTKYCSHRIARLQKDTTLRKGLFLQFHHPTKPTSDRCGRVSLTTLVSGWAGFEEPEDCWTSVRSASGSIW